MPLAPPLSFLSARQERAAPEGVSADVREAQRGNVAAFERLYREHVGRVYALCLRLVADSTRAEQFTQDAFVRAWENLASFRGESPFGGWLRQLAVNVVMAEMRATSRRTKRVFATEDEEVLGSASADRTDGERLDLERAIGTLPEGARTVFVLHDVEGYGHDEIGRLMGIAEGTSKAQLHKARAKLKEALQ